MDYTLFLSRRLSQGGCVLAGTQLATYHEQLEAELKDHKIKLAPKVEAAVLKTIAQTKTLGVLTSNDAAMVDVDRSTDRCVAAIHDQLDAVERCFDRGSLLPLTSEQAARLADAQLVRGALFPSGTAFLRLPYSQQWLEMNNTLRALGGKDIAAAAKRLGIEQEMGRLRGWVELYGAKLGVTEVEPADPAVAVLQAWHDAYGALFAHAHSEYDDREDATHARIREALLSPYLRQADEERRAEQKAKARREKADTPPADQ